MWSISNAFQINLQGKETIHVYIRYVESYNLHNIVMHTNMWLLIEVHQGLEKKMFFIG